MKQKIVVILGPTATGKSHCGIKLALKLQTEIISGDSMLVYKKMNIGTAKPSADELALVPHHFVNILEPPEDFNVFDFKAKAEVLITEINARGKIPLLVGGTGLYIKALLENYNFASVNEKNELRRELEVFADEQGNSALYSKLVVLDSEAASRLHVNDRRRVIRAIETALEGEKVSQTHSNEVVYDAVVFGLRMPRAKLYERINARVDDMVRNGLFEETKKLLEAGIPAEAQSMKSIGYRQAFQYYNGEMTKEEAIDKIKQYTRNFAKRQVTWYNKMPYIQWFDLENDFDYDQIAEDMFQILVKKFKLL
ncbi:MAG: tRNA (adenosine(37)-N6)-dimethylallyltransferase MiaA [Negativicutes bacterium]|nr:tRNA (adenosine(37)-N6)-dimethylallyltransferase MiaA [Negativicutes bacterium]